MQIKKQYLFLWIGLWGAFQAPGQNRPAALNAFLRSESLKHASVSFQMTDLSTGRPVAAYNESVSLPSASILKLVTTATALEVLGSGFSYSTPLFYDGFIEGSTLNGDLYIEGAGDPTLGSEFTGKDPELFLKTGYDAIQQRGIQRVTGNIVVLDQLFGYTGVSPKWLWEDLGNYYAAGVYGISIFDNMYRVHLRSYAPGSATTLLHTTPEMNGLEFTNTITASSSDADNSFISGVPFSRQRQLYGSIPAHRSAFAVKGDMPDPGLFLAAYFKEYLQKNGIPVGGDATTYRLSSKEPKTKQELALVRSPDLASIIRIIHVRSNNHYAEHLYKWLTLKTGIDIPAYWGRKGLDASALFLYDGSGLSPANAVSADFLVQLLAYMNGRGKDFYFSLPIAGKEGTVASFLKGTALEGQARIKSGSMTNIQSYAGYIDKNGKRYAFSLTVNYYNGQRAVLRREIEKLLSGLL